MITRQTIKYSAALLMLTTLLMAMSFVPSLLAANFPLEIINIKPAGTGDPAIPSSNRIFRAYPGVEYNIRAAVVGGLYPFSYSLYSGPAGMTIDSSTGEISWPNPQSNSGTITLSVTDAENTTATTNWAITVGTTGFIFVDSTDVTSTETGGIDEPYKSISSLLTNTSSMTDIVYFREGNYTFANFNSANTNEINTNSKATTWLGYPDETVSINGNDHFFRNWTSPIYMDSLNFHNFKKWAFNIQGGYNYQTFRRCVFTDLVAADSINDNQGFLYFNHGDPSGKFLVIQDNELSNFTGASAIGSIYDSSHVLIEDNYIHTSGGSGLTGINNGIAPKNNVDNLTIRHNRVIMTSGYILGNAMNSIMFDCNGIDISFNYFCRDSTSLTGAFFERSDGPQTDVYYYKNTVVGYVGFERVDGDNCSAVGDVHVYNNVIINENALVHDGSAWNMVSYLSYHPWLSSNSPENCITDTDNLKGTAADNIVDSSGNLNPSFISYIGTHGHQIQQTKPNTPTNWRIN